MKTSRMILALLIALSMNGCCLFTAEEASPSCHVLADGTRLNRIPGVTNVDIPAGVTDKQVLDAVEKAITGTHPGNRKVAMVSQWRPELRDPANKWIRVGLTARNHYLRVCYRIENSQLIPDVPFSTNLKQEGTKIHRKAHMWINNFNALIAQQLYAEQNGTDCSGAKKPITSKTGE